ncbi:hypothetical protein [Nonomuraea turcica]|uniref:hypothetical protein n=1 Tax=Nonomuraea sp. G32 TaxID=3067274 RepID=UPI00273BD20C|nr:hypothetical protein [Nonomuraea sp. G32]MDP4501116.1 hypothetical protein [Nonomuraea sp. G32]
MGVAIKLASLTAVLGGGSALMLWLLFGGHVALAWLALVGTAALSGAVIVLITLETRREDRTPQ